MKKNKIAAGLNGLLNAATEATKPTTPAAVMGAGTRPVCYNLNPVMIEKIRYIAFMEHRKNNAAVSEALAHSVTEWAHTHALISVPS